MVKYQSVHIVVKHEMLHPATDQISVCSPLAIHFEVAVYFCYLLLLLHNILESIITIVLTLIE